MATPSRPDRLPRRRDPSLTTLLGGLAPGASAQARSATVRQLLDETGGEGGAAVFVRDRASEKRTRRPAPRLTCFDAVGCAQTLRGADVSADRTGGSIATAFRTNAVIADRDPAHDSGDAVTRARLHQVGRRLRHTVPLVCGTDAPIGTLAVFGETQMGSEELRGIAAALALALTDDEAAEPFSRLDLRDALDSGQIGPYFQPVIDLADHAVVGAEALARWERSDGTVVPPDEFLPAVKRHAMMGDLTYTMLQRSLRQLSSWLNTGVVSGEFTMAVNIATNDAALRHLPGIIADLLAETEVEATRLCVELTETEPISDRQLLHGVLSELRAFGATIAVDDFGTEHASFSRITSLPVDVVKIDRSFVTDLPGDRSSRAVIEAIVDVAAAHQLVVLGEGVETVEQADALRSLGVALGQGYLFGRPVPAELFGQLLV